MVVAGITNRIIETSLIVLLVFGAGKIPKIARDLGSGIREFKKSFDGTNDDKEEDDKKKE